MGWYRGRPRPLYSDDDEIGCWMGLVMFIALVVLIVVSRVVG